MSDSLLNVIALVPLSSTGSWHVPTTNTTLSIRSPSSSFDLQKSLCVAVAIWMTGSLLSALGNPPVVLRHSMSNDVTISGGMSMQSDSTRMSFIFTSITLE